VIETIQNFYHRNPQKSKRKEKASEQGAYLQGQGDSEGMVTAAAAAIAAGASEASAEASEAQREAVTPQNSFLRTR
jgi:hypothetical protein